jgi:hypothetical protein
MHVEEYLRSEAAERGVRDDWEVRTGPNGITVDVWTSDRYTRSDQASRIADRILRDILELGYQVDGPCEIDAQRDVDGDWRGHLVVRLRAPAPGRSTMPTAPTMPAMSAYDVG